MTVASICETVVSLCEIREARLPHWRGKAICLGCRHVWEAAAPIGVVDGLECPDCSLPKGVVKNLWAAPEGSAELQCTDCGSHVLTCYIRKDGLKVVRCIGCGLDLTDTFFT